MATQTNTGGSRFAVDLGDVKLPDIVEKRLEAEIQAIVLRELAATDLGGRSRLSPIGIEKFAEGILGFILNWFDGMPPPWNIPWRSPGATLTVEDHTLVVRAIMEHPFEVIQYMDKKDRTSKPSPIAVLQAALRVQQIDSYTKERIRMALDILPRLEEARKNAPADLQRSLDDLQKRLARRSIQEQISTLRSLTTNYRDQDGLREGMDFAARMLEDGQSSIYSPEFPYYRMLEEGQRGARSVKEDIKDADTLGAVAGGGVGVFVGGIGAGPGAAAGGAGASAGAAIGHAILWLFF